MEEKQKIQRFEDLPVWKDAQNFAVSIYELTKSFPGEERYGLSSQMRRAASSISANIAEGFGRKSGKDKAHFYTIAYGSLLETKNFIYLARRLNYIEADDETRLVNNADGLQKQINAISKYLRSHE